MQNPKDQRLESAWRAVVARLIHEGYDPGDVNSTMLTIAVVDCARLHGRAAVRAAVVAALKSGNDAACEAAA